MKRNKIVLIGHVVIDTKWSIIQSTKCSELEHKVYKSWLNGEDDPLGTVQEIEIWPYEQVVYAQPRMLRKNFSDILIYKRIT